MDFMITRSALTCVGTVSVTAFTVLLTLAAFDLAAAELNEPVDCVIAWPLRDVAAAAGFSASNASRTLNRAVEELKHHPWIEEIDITAEGLSWRMNSALRPRHWYSEPYLRASLNEFEGCVNSIDIYLRLVQRLIARMRHPIATLRMPTLLRLIGSENNAAGWKRLRPLLREGLQRLAVGTDTTFVVLFKSEGVTTPQKMLLKAAPAAAANTPVFKKSSPLDEHWLVKPDETVMRRARGVRLGAPHAPKHEEVCALAPPVASHPLVLLADRLSKRGIDFVDVRVALAQLHRCVGEKATRHKLEMLLALKDPGFSLNQRLGQLVDSAVKQSKRMN